MALRTAANELPILQSPSILLYASSIIAFELYQKTRITLAVVNSFSFIIHGILMPPPLIGGGIKRCFCLTSVCRVHRALLENREATKIGTEVAHVRGYSDTAFKVKRSKVKVTRPLWVAVQITT